jgi:hypothetical protein
MISAPMKLPERNWGKGIFIGTVLIWALSFISNTEFSSTSGTSFEVEAAMIPRKIRKTNRVMMTKPTRVASRLLRKFFITIFF